MKLKKIMLVSVVLVMFVLPFVGALTAAPGGDCGCAETYMGAAYTGGFCVWVEQPDGSWEMAYRHCYYEY